MHAGQKGGAPAEGSSRRAQEESQNDTVCQKYRMLSLNNKTAIGMAGVIPQFRRKIKMPGDFYLLPVCIQYDIF